MGFTDKLKEWFRKEEKEPEPIDRFEKIGIQVLSDKRLTKRIQLIHALHEELENPIADDVQPDEKLRKLRNRLQLLNKALKTLATPYGRAGDNPVYREAMHGWEILYAVAMDIINTVDHIIQSSAEKKVKTVIVDQKKVVAELQKQLETKGEAKIEAEIETYQLLTFKIDLKEIVRKLESFLQVEVFPYAFLIMDVSFYEKDVTPSYAAIIQNLVPPYINPREPYPQPLGGSSNEQWR